MDIREPIHSEHAKTLDTSGLRRHFLIDRLFVPGEITMTYSHIDRIVVGGAQPLGEALAVKTGKEFGTDYFLERRELGIINIGGPGTVIVDGTGHALGNRDGLYVGLGNRDIAFASADAASPAKFYYASAPAHAAYPTVKVTPDDAQPQTLGEAETANVRTINKYLHPAVLKSCQLSMGLTKLAPGSLWNTMPCHTHERRMEVYMYFDLAAEDGVVFHMMGEPSETRHVVVRSEQAVISPSWSIHSGVGTASYSFIWAMVGENQVFDDMDFIAMPDLG